MYRLGRLAGNILYLIPEQRKLVTANLNVAFPEKSKQEIRRLAISSLSHLPRVILEFFWIANRPDRINKHTIIPESEWEKIRRLQRGDKKRAILFVCPHLGGWEVSAMMVAHWIKCPFASIAAKLQNPHLNKLIVKCRSTEDIRVIPAKGAIRGMVKAFKDGYSMGTLIDQNTKVRDGGIWVDFFGLPVPTSPAPAYLGKKFDVSVCIGGAVINQDNIYELFIDELDHPFESYPDDESIIRELLEKTQALARKYPEQYLWMYKRFQYIPKDATEDVKKLFPFYAKIAPKRFYDKVEARKNCRKSA